MNATIKNDNPKKAAIYSLQLLLVIEDKRVDCYWCGKVLRECGTCHGSGQYKEHNCLPCGGSGRICSKHGADWDV
ncbi:MAG: hypothetical protein JWO06_739 [Bacteroidota bacterium]|nr:hypothetical protein [Bacteroidota bacterium]